MSNPDIICGQAANDSFLLNLDTGAFQGVNGTGFLIWRMLSRPRTQAEIIAQLVRMCRSESAGGVSPTQVAADVADFLQALQPGGFIGVVLDDAGGLNPWTAVHPPATDASPAAAMPSPKSSPDSDRIFDLSLYRGRSMLGLFRPGDALTIEPVPMAAVRPGDVVIYRGCNPGGQPVDVVHRVIAVTPGGLATRGDNNPCADQGLVNQENLLGRVTRRVRNGRARRVLGGRRGLLLVRLRRALRAGLRSGLVLVRTVGRRPYRWLRESGLARCCWRPALTRLALAAPPAQATDNGPLIKYIRNRRTVAWWQPGSGRFRCRKPYDLVITRHD